MPSTITLRFDAVPLVNDYLELKVGDIPQNNLRERFVTTRTASFQSGTVTANIPATRNEYILAFNADYNGNGLGIYTIDFSGSDTVIITHPTDGFFDNGDIDNSTSGAIVVVSIVDEPDVAPIDFVDTSFAETTDPCNNVKVVVETSVLATIYRINGGADIPNTFNPFSFDVVRGQFFNLEVESADGETNNENIQVPSSLAVSNTTINILNSPSGATITIVVTNAEGLELEYSLDDVLYQSSNVFSNIVQGSYTAYIKDQLGCSIQVPFEVPAYEDGGVGVFDAYSDLPSKSNSIRFAKRVDWGICTNYKNDENTLGCELPYTQNPRQVNQLFQECDIITTQIKSNYDTNVVTIIQEDGTEVLVPVDKKSNNLDLKDKRDATRYGLPDGRAGIYFTSGNTYDFDTNVINGTYALNGALPQWGRVGNYVIIVSTWFQIVDIVYDESINAEVLVLDETFLSQPESIIIGSIYNAELYEVYEFTIDMSIYPDQSIQVNITQTDVDPNYPEVVYLSEILEIQESHPNTIAIDYYNTVNTDILYATGIKMRIRVPIEYMVGTPLDSAENEKTDVTTYLINSEVYELDEINFDLLSKQLMRKLIQALSHNTVSINEVPYIKNDSVSSTPLIGTNLYRVVATMVKAESVYTSNGTGEQYSEGYIEVPGLIEQTSEGYIKWKN
jgi:hypothetical protein